MSSSTASSDRRIMRVRWFDRRKGYGFLVPVTQALESDSQDNTIFVYHNQLRTLYMDNIFRMLYAGEYVECDLSVDDKGRTVAQNVTGVQDGPLMCEVRAMNTQNAPDGDEEQAPVDRQPRRGGFRGRGRGRGRAPMRSRPQGDTDGLDA